MTFTRSPRALFLSLLFAGLAGVAQTQAATATWNSGSGAWNQSGKWNTGVVPGTTPAGDTANFGVSVDTPNVITLDNGAGTAFSPTLSNLNVNAAGATTAGVIINSGAGGSLKMAANATIQWNTGPGTGQSNAIGANVVMKGNLNLSLTGSAASPALIISGVISDGNSGFDVNISGPGSVTFQGANTYFGTTRVNSGTLSLNHTGGNSLAGDLVVSGGTVNFLQANQISGISNITVSSGVLNLNSSINNVAELKVTGGSLTGSTGVLSSASTIDIQGGSIGVILGGGVSLLKSGAGTATLSKANIYTGTTTVSAGTLVLSSLQGNAIAGNAVVSGGTLQLDRSNQIADSKTVSVTGGTFALGTNSETVAGVQLTNNGSITASTGVLTSTTAYDMQRGSVSAVLGGNAGMNKTTAGIVTLTAANTFTGTTTVTAGTLNLNTTGAPALAGNVVLNGGTLALQQSNQVMANKTIGVTGGILSLGANSNTVAGVQLTNGGTIQSTTGVLTSTTNYDMQNGTVAAVLGGSVGLTKTTVNTVTLTGVNTYTGTTTATSGTLNLNTTGGTAVAGDVMLNGGTVALQQSNQINTAKTVTIASGTLELGANSNTVAGLKMTGGIYHSTTGTLTSTTAYDIQAGTISGKLGGSVGLNKTGAGAATLTGANTYTGDTTVSAGTLFLNTNGAPAIAGNLVVNGGSVSMQRSNQINAAKTITLSAGSMTLGANSNTVAGLSMTGGSLLGTTGVITSTTDYDIQAGTVEARLGGSVDLNKTGAGQAFLYGANTFTGTTTVSGGELHMGSVGVAAIAGDLVIKSGAKVIFEESQQIASSKTVTIEGGTLNMMGNNTTASGLVLKQNGLLQGNRFTGLTPYDLQSGTVEAILAGVVGADVKFGTVTLNGANTYTGLTKVSSGGSLLLASSSGPALAGDLTVLANSTVTLGQSLQTASTKILTLDGGTLDTDRWSTTVGSLVLKNGGAILGHGTVFSNGTFDLQGGTVKANLSGTGGVTVSSGNVILAGHNTYIGNTYVGGTLTVQGSINSPGLFTVGGGTLAGGGLIKVGTVLLQSGSINLSPGGIIDGALRTLGGSFVGVGTVTGGVNVAGGTLTIADQAVLTALSGVTVNGGTLSVAGTVAGNVVLDDFNTLAFKGTGNVTGTVMVGGSGARIFGSGTVGSLMLTPKVLLLLGSSAILTVTKGELNAPGYSSILGGTLATGIAGFKVNNHDFFYIGSNLSSTGGLIKTGDGTLVLLGNSTLGGATQIRSGTLTLDGTLKTSSLEIAAGALFNGSGTLITSLLTNNGVLNPGHSPGTLRINGSFTQGRSGTLVLEVQDNTVYDHVIVSGTVRLGGTLAVRDWAGHRFAMGDIVPGFVQAGRIEGRFDKVTMPSANLRARLVNDGQNLSLVAAPVSYTQVAKPGNQMQVARALDRWIGHETGDVGLVTLALDVQREPQYATAFNAIGPAYYSILPQVGIEEAGAQQSLMQQRFAEIHSSRPHNGMVHLPPEKVKSPDSGKELTLYPWVNTPEEDPWTEWVQLSGQFARLQTLQSLADANFDSAGAMAGIDHRLGNESAIGVAVGYNYTHLGFNAGEGSAIDTGRLMLYGTAGLGDGYFLDASVSGGYTNYDLKRPVKFSFIDRVARGRTDGSELSAAVHFSKEFHVKSLSVTPQIGLQYTRIHVNGLNETNAGALNLAVNGYGGDSLRGTLGMQVAYNAKLSERATLTPYLSLSWQHEFDSPAQTVRAALPAEGGGEFLYEGGSFGGDRMQAGAGLMLLLDDKISINLGYQAEFGSNDYESHLIMLMLSYRF